MEQQKLELIDIYDISYEPWWLSTGAKITLCIVILFLIAGLGYWVYKKTRKPMIVVYWQKALNDITALENYEVADGQAFYMQLTEIMKQYLQERYVMHFVDKTDTELLELLKTTPAIPHHVYETMHNLFEGVMFIKFAHQQAAQERMQEAVTKIKALILLLNKEVL